MFNKKILVWYEINKRSLPWRETKNPYKIWISEVILQQTRVVQGLSYYKKFIKLFPTPTDLALASEEEVLNAWQGLGYYSRARNLHFAAKQILENHNGNFPDTYKGVRELKGVGEYTAAAVTSIAFEMPHAVVDGNVYRLFSRLFGVHTPIDSSPGKKEFNALADKLLLRNNPGDYNQAVMEFGGQVCKPKNPDCENCIFKLECIAYKNGTVFELPVKSKKIKVVDRFFYYFLFRYDDTLYMKKRGPKDIWQGLFELPLIETKRILSLSEIQNSFNEIFGEGEISDSGFSKIHVLSHRRINAFFYIHNSIDEPKLENYTRVEVKDLAKFPISRLTEQFFMSNGIL